MALSSVVISSTSLLEKSYRAWTLGSRYPDAEKKVVLEGTVTLLRRHSINGTLCPSCCNNDLDNCRVTGLDQLEFITQVQCLVCDTYLSTACRTSQHYYERIRDPSTLVRGDHIGWHRPLAYWHHAIVVGQYADHLTTVEYSVSTGSPSAAVCLKEYPHRSVSSLLRGTLYRITHEDCYPDEYTALRAEKTLGEEKYDFFEQNCEHSINWCKTGLHSSYQLESFFTTLGKVVLTIFLRAVILGVLALLQIFNLAGHPGVPRGEITLDRAIDIWYISLIVITFVVYSLYKDCGRMLSTSRYPERIPDNDRTEACRKSCTNETYKRCCRSNPRCSHLTCFVCFLGCFCCSLAGACCSLCSRKFQICCTPCCGRPVPESMGLLIRIVIRELIAASGPFVCIWFKGDIVAYLEGEGVLLTPNTPANQALIILGAVILASIVSYPAGVLLSRWSEGLLECCCSLCTHSSAAGQCIHDESPTEPCPLHDKVLNIPSGHVGCYVTKIPMNQATGNNSTVVRGQQIV